MIRTNQKWCGLIRNVRRSNRLLVSVKVNYGFAVKISEAPGKMKSRPRSGIIMFAVRIRPNISPSFKLALWKSRSISGEDTRRSSGFSQGLIADWIKSGASLLYPKLSMRAALTTRNSKAYGFRFPSAEHLSTNKHIFALPGWLTVLRPSTGWFSHASQILDVE